MTSHTLEEEGVAYVVVRATLAGRENGVVDALLEVLCVLKILAEEDETSTGATEGLVGGRGDDIAVLEGVSLLPSSDKTADVGNICHEVRAMLVSNLTQSSVIPVPRVRRGTTDDKAGLEDPSLLRQTLVIDQLRRGIKGVWERLEVD